MNRQHLLLLVIMLAVGAIAAWLYWPARQGEFLHWDDYEYLATIEHWQKVSWASTHWAFSSTGHDYYSPLTWLSYFFDHQVAGMNARRFHATSVVIHALNAGVVCLLVWLLTGAAGARATTRFSLAALVGLVFGVHPLQVESVAWLAERKTVLSAHFTLWSLCAYAQSAPSARPKPWRLAALLFFVLALLAKPQAVTVPLVMLALDLYPLRRWPAISWRQLISEKLPYWLLSIACSALTVKAVFAGEGSDPVSVAGVQSRCLVTARGTIFYLWKLFWPSWLSPYYPLEGEVSLRILEFVMTGIVFGALSASACWCVRRWPAWTSAWAAYLAFLLPVIGLVRTGNQAVADRYMYLALLPIVLLAAGGGLWLWHRLHPTGRTALAVLAGCYLLFLGYSTRAQIPVWHDDVSMWSAAWMHFPNSGLVNSALSKALARRGDLTDAMRLAQRAVQLNPETEETHLQIGVLDVLWITAARPFRNCRPRSAWAPPVIGLGTIGILHCTIWRGPTVARAIPGGRAKFCKLSSPQPGSLPRSRELTRSWTISGGIQSMARSSRRCCVSERVAQRRSRRRQIGLQFQRGFQMRNRLRILPLPN